MNYRSNIRVNSFNEVDSYDFPRQLTDKVKNEIEGKGKEYILGVDEEEFKNYLIDKYTVDPLIINFNNEYIGEPVVTVKSGLKVGITEVKSINLMYIHLQYAIHLLDLLKCLKFVQIHSVL